jgi:methylmalonyl-CoA mutase C-terminal domain/subunit
LHRTVEEIVATAIQEDVDLIGLSILSGAHLPISEKLIAQLKQAGCDTPVVVGGNIPRRDHDKLHALGVAGVFATSSELAGIAQSINEIVARQQNG